MEGLSQSGHVILFWAIRPEQKASAFLTNEVTDGIASAFTFLPRIGKMMAGAVAAMAWS